MNKIRFVLPMLIVLLFSFASLASAAPLRLAQAPVILHAYCPPDVEDALNAQVSRATHVPLNDFLQAVEYLPSQEIMTALGDLRQTGRKAKYKEIVKPLAEELKADMVVLPVLTGYQHWQRLSWRLGLIEHCYASVELYVYDARTDELVRKSASRFYDDESSARASAAHLAKEAMDQVLRTSRLHERIYPAQKAFPSGEGGSPQG